MNGALRPRRLQKPFEAWVIHIRHIHPHGRLGPAAWPKMAWAAPPSPPRLTANSHAPISLTRRRAGFRSIPVISLHSCLDGLETEHRHFEQLDFAPTLMKQLDRKGRLLAKFFF
jgi:hypothetical protein